MSRREIRLSDTAGVTDGLLGVNPSSPFLQLTPANQSFPAELRTLSPAVEEIWLRGDLDVLAQAPRVALVGSRSPTPYGLEQAGRLSQGLARAGVVIVSGLARGIDQASHAAALDAGGATIAVVGSGLDRLWPRGPVTDRVEREGLLLSEYSPGTPPRRHHFPLRNRLIAALSLGVVVVEAAARSGSLITARWALDMGREIMAVPGRVDHPMARGAHRLLREGATLVESPADILDALELKLGATEAESTLPEEPLLRALVGETLSPKELAQQLDRPLPEVMAELAVLDLDGRVARVPGGLYRLVQRH